MSRSFVTATLTALTLAVAAAFPIAAAAAPTGPGAEREAERSLAAAERAFSGSVRRSRGATLALRDLALALPDLSGADRRQARALLSRPDEGNEPQFDPNDPNANGNWRADAETDSQCSLHFCAHWVTSDGAPPRKTDEIDLSDDNDNGTPDYIDAGLASAERSYQVQNVELGWPQPENDGTRGGTPQNDIYFSQLVFSENFGLFGYANTDRGDPCLDDQPYRCAGYLVLDNDYSEFGYEDPLLPLRVTMAHEYNHILQFAIDLGQDTWMFESTATWAEEKVYPKVDDYVFYLDFFADSPADPMTSAGGGQGLKIYASAIWNHWIDSRFGEDVVREAWTGSRKARPRSFAIEAYGRAIRQFGGSGFAREFARFAATTAEWRDATEFPDARSYPKQVDRAGRLNPGQSVSAKLDNTAFRLYDVPNPGGGTLRLEAEVQRDTRSAVALIGRRSGRQPLVRLDYLPNGRAGNVKLKRVGGYDRVTVALINADGRAKRRENARPFREKWNYVRNDRLFRATLR